MANKLTYANKVDTKAVVQRNQQVVAADFNEIKASFNGLLDELGIGGVDDNVRIVSINTGAATNKIKGVLEAILDSSPSKPYLVQVRPGTYIEDNFTIPQYVTFISEGGSNVTIIEAKTTTGNLITLSTSTKALGFTISNKTAGVGIDASAVGFMSVGDIINDNCAIGIKQNNANSFLDLVDIATLSSSGTITDGILINAGANRISRISAAGAGNITRLVHVNGSGISSSIYDIISTMSTLGTGLKVDGSAIVTGVDLLLRNCATGIHARGGCTFTATGTVIRNTTSAGFLNDGTDVDIITFFASEAESNTGLHFNITNPNARIYGSVKGILANSFIHPATFRLVTLLNDFEGDESYIVSAELSVGTPTHPRESCFGEGDSHTNLLAYTSINDVDFVDVTAAAKSFSGSTVTFPGLTDGNSIYLCNLLTDPSLNQLTFFGLKTLLETAGVVGAGSFTIQYWNDNSGWIDANYMETQSNRRFYQYAKNIFAHTGSHHIRGPLELQIDADVNTKWDVNDLPSTGTDRYWIRLRTVGTITTAPIFQQFKLHTNRTEINGDGWMEYFGAARPKGELPIVLGAGRELSGSMGNQNIWIDQNLGIGLIDNQFSLTNQYFGIGGALPDDLDTGSQVKMVILLRGNGAGTNTFTCTYGTLNVSDTVYTSNPALGPIPSRKVDTKSVVFAGAGDVQRLEFILDLSDFRARKDPADGNTDEDTLVITINATTVNTNCQMILSRVAYYKWCEGGHI